MPASPTLFLTAANFAFHVHAVKKKLTRDNRFSRENCRAAVKIVRAQRTQPNPTKKLKLAPYVANLELRFESRNKMLHGARNFWLHILALINIIYKKDYEQQIQPQQVSHYG